MAREIGVERHAFFGSEQLSIGDVQGLAHGFSNAI